MKLAQLLLAAVLAAAPLAAEPAPAAQRTVTTTYGLSLLGLSIGRASFDTVIDESRYSVAGTLSSAGIAALFSETAGTSSVSGRVGNGRLFADRYALAYTSDDKRWSSDVAFEAGKVTSARVAPKRAKPKPDYVPVTPAQLAAVVDPLSGLMIRTSDPNAVCGRTLPFFDGWSRLDLQLAPAGRDAYAMDGFSGEAVVCDVRIRPLGGYEKSSKGLKYFTDRSIRLWFAPIAADDLFVPVQARIPTQVGPLTLNATSVSIR